MKPEDFTSERAGRVERTMQGYWAFIPSPLAPDITYAPSLVKLLGDAQHLLGELAGVGRRLPAPYFLAQPLIRREAEMSSRIEGTVTNLRDLFVYEVAPDEPTAPDVGEVNNYVLALEYGLRRLDELPVSLRLLREIHERLMRDVRGGYATPGEFRASQNWIGRPGSLLDEATIVPPPVGEMHDVV